MSGPRLLIVTTVPGTLSHFLLPYAERMRALGWAVDAATGDLAESPSADVLDAFDNVWTVPWRRDVGDPRNWTAALREVRRVLRERDYDVVHTHTPVASFVTRVAVGSLARRRRPAVAYTAHGFHFHPEGGRVANAAFVAAERLAGRWTDRLLVLTDQDLEAARSRRIVREDQVSFVPGVGIDLDHYRPTPPLLAAAAALREELGVAAGRPLFTVVAALQGQKGHLTAVRALAAPGLDAVLACAGSGPHREAILAEAARLGVADRVLLLGSLRDVRPLVLASTATVLASRREGLSRAVLESLALGVPVLGSRIRGITELLAVPDAGVLVEPGDVEGFAAAMRAAEALPGPVERRRRLEGHLQQYGIEAVLDRHVELYEELASSRTTLAAAVRRQQPSRWP